MGSVGRSKAFVREKVAESPVLFSLGWPLVKAWRYLAVYRPWLTDEARLRQLYRQKMKTVLDLDRPKTFNEKIQWLKLNDRSALHMKCADKLAVRDYVRDTVGDRHLVPLHFVVTDPAEITPERLPDTPVVMKTNHSSGTVFIITNRNTCDFRALRTKIRFAMIENLYWPMREWQYAKVEPAIMCEHLLGSEDGVPVADYKIFCMNGVPKMVQVDHGRFGGHTRNLYDAEWSHIPVAWGYRLGPPESRPAEFDEMIRIAKALSAPFIFARIDLYLSGGEIFVGEITFHPTSGIKPFDPPSFDRSLGDMLVLPTDRAT